MKLVFGLGIFVHEGNDGRYHVTVSNEDTSDDEKHVLLSGTGFDTEEDATEFRDKLGELCMTAPSAGKIVERKGRLQ